VKFGKGEFHNPMPFAVKVFPPACPRARGLLCCATKHAPPAYLVVCCAMLCVRYLAPQVQAGPGNEKHPFPPQYGHSMQGMTTHTIHVVKETRARS